MSTYRICNRCDKIIMPDASEWTKNTGRICLCDTMPRRNATRPPDGAQTSKRDVGHTPQNAPTEAKPNKYRACKVEVDGITFDSKKEGRRYRELTELLTAGRISELECQPAFTFIVNGVKVASYTGDFRYKQNGEYVVEDCKSAITRKVRDYPIRKKLMKACFGIDITEI